MSTPTLQLIGGQSPWEIVRAYGHITVKPLDDGMFQIACRTPDGSGWPFMLALETLTAEERRRFDTDMAAEREPAGSEAMIPARALMRLVRLVKAATGTEPPAWRMFYDVEHDRSRHPSAQAERVIRGRPRGGG
jgi:hypothetical protein